MTKAALRRQEREREAQEAAGLEVNTSAQQQQQGRDAITPQPSGIPHMEPPPPYDAAHLSRSNSSNSSNFHHRGTGQHNDPGCLTFGPGPTGGCLVGI